jgi:hypothetical protein
MRLLTALLAIAFGARGALLQGIVLDFDSGRALARTSVTLTPLQSGATASPLAIRTESNGSFFFNAQPGAYLLTLQREGFALYRHGAKCGTCPGAPMFLNGDDRTVVDIRMHRLGAITGTVLDENQIGIPDIPVLVFTATRPLRLTAQVKTDDRGFFRIAELMPGSYVFRTAPSKQNDGASYLASYYPEGTDLKYVRPVPADLDRTWTNVDFPAIMGKLYRVQGKLLMPSPGFTAAIELISDSGRLKSSVDAQGNFAFDNVAPGNYEFFAEGRSQLGHFASWLLFLVEHDSDVNVPMLVCPPLFVSIADEKNKHIQKNAVKVFMRRKDLDKEGPAVPILEGRNDLAPGDWEITVNGGDEFYPRDVRVAMIRAEKRSHDSAEGWVVGHIPDTTVTSGVPMQIVISSRVSSLSGRVLEKTNEPAAYAPVLLETLGLEPPDPQILREVRAGSDGVFRFNGLPPGKYRVLASFDLDWSDRNGIEAARPFELSIKEGENVTQDLALYHKP